jgi:molybdate transport system regulatory protein
MALKPDIKLHIRGSSSGRGGDGELAIGPGKIALLEAIADTGSITSAAKKLRMSYRRAWLLIAGTNRCLTGPAVETSTGGTGGGGASLTPLGVELVRRYRALEKQAKAAASRKLTPLLRGASTRKP